MLTLLFAFACSGDKTQDSGDHDHDTGVEDTGTEDTGSEDTGDEQIIVPDTYSFSNDAGESTVSYSGQVARHLLIADLKSTMNEIQPSIDNNSWTLATKQEIVDYLSFNIDCPNDTCDDLNISSMSDVHNVLSDISGGKKLVGKLTGNDSVTDHKDWTDGNSFKGWPGVESPEALVRAWIDMTADQTLKSFNGDAMVPGEDATTNALGHNFTQLIQKMLLGAVAYSQGTDDYMDDDKEGKGLLASNIPADGKTYSPLGHAWDEGFGYFGAAQDYNAYTDLEIKSGDKIDTNGDNLHDPKSEGNRGHSVNAAKRDYGSKDLAPTDYTQQAWDGFIQGRALINSKLGTELSADELAQLKVYRDAAIDAWERAIAATVVHYVNDCLQDINAFDGDIGPYAKHWGELKGFALGLQFNPASQLSDADFVAFHDLIGTAPVLPNDAGIEAYKADLISARDILGNSYGFDSANLGDENGENGW